MNQHPKPSSTVSHAAVIGATAAIIWGVVDATAVAIWGHRIPLPMPVVVVAVYLTVGLAFGTTVGIATHLRLRYQSVTESSQHHAIVRQAILNAAIMLSLAIFLERARRGFAYVTDPSPIVPLTLACLAALATIIRARPKTNDDNQPASWTVTVAFTALFCTLWSPFSQLYKAPLLSWTSFLGATSYLALVAIAFMLTRRIAKFAARELRFDHLTSMIKTSTAVAIAGLALATSILWINTKQPLISDFPGTAVTNANNPNVVLIVMDCARADMLSAYGYPQQTTPILEKFAKESFKYDHAVATAPWTLPSHASMFTGLLPSQHKAHQIPDGNRTSIRPLDERFDTLAEALTRRGYQTAAVVANAACLSRELGMGQGFQYYDDRVTASFAAAKTKTISPILWLAHWYKNRAEPSETGWSRNAAEINRDVYTWLDTINDKPFFLFINYLDAHEPYVSHRQFAQTLGQPARDRWSTDVANDVAHYQQEIAFVDHQIGRLFDRLKNDGRYDNSLIIVTSDHGEAFGEHGHFGHCGTLHEEELHVPLFVRYPNRKIIGVGKAPISLASLPDLVADVIKQPLVQQLGQFDKPPHVVAELRVCESGSCGIARATYLEDGRKLLFDGRGGVQLYNLAADPHEQYDLSFLADHRVLTSQSQLLKWANQIHEPDNTDSESPLDLDLQRRLQSLGYVD